MTGIRVLPPTRPAEMPETRALYAQWIVREAPQEIGRSAEPAVRDAFENGLFASAIQGIKTCTPYWVTPEMSDLTFVARQTHNLALDPTPLCRDGMVIFAKQTTLTDTDGSTMTVGGLFWGANQAFPIPWHPNGLGLGMPVPTRGDDLADLMVRDQVETPAARPCLEIAGLLQTFWLLASQRLAVTTSQTPDRATRRRCERLATPAETVQIVDLRRQCRAAADGTPTDVDWSHRWMVDGHWRNQWCPSIKGHRQTWISPYVKGPEDKPLVLHEKVYRWKR